MAHVACSSMEACAPRESGHVSSVTDGWLMLVVSWLLVVVVVVVLCMLVAWAGRNRCTNRERHFLGPNCSS